MRKETLAGLIAQAKAVPNVYVVARIGWVKLEIKFVPFTALSGKPPRGGTLTFLLNNWFIEEEQAAEVLDYLQDD